MADGTPAFAAARTIPIASPVFVIVMAVTRSAAVEANVSICGAW
jgi:hypothetical protein